MTMKNLRDYEVAAAKVVEVGGYDVFPVNADSARETFLSYRKEKMQSIETGIAEWNKAVASAVERVSGQNGLVRQIMGDDWHSRVAEALSDMAVPLHSDVILSVEEPYLTNRLMAGRLRIFGATTMSENPEFMPTTTTEWPSFPYFIVEPGTPIDLAKARLTLLANPPGVTEEEGNIVGSAISSMTYARTPMVSIDLRVADHAGWSNGAALINWSFRGRQGAMTKVFIDGLLDVPAFPVASTDEDRTPNFWTVLPLRRGMTVVDLKHVGGGFMWFEHADVHTVVW